MCAPLDKEGLGRFAVILNECEGSRKYNTPGFFGRFTPSEWQIYTNSPFWIQRRMYSTNPPPLRGPPPLLRRKDPPPLTKGDAEGRGICYTHKKFLFHKKCYIYNIMSCSTFWHQKNLKNLNSQLWYLSIFIKKFTILVNFTKLVNF